MLICPNFSKNFEKVETSSNMLYEISLVFDIIIKDTSRKTKTRVILPNGKMQISQQNFCKSNPTIFKTDNI